MCSLTVKYCSRSSPHPASLTGDTNGSCPVWTHPPAVMTQTQSCFCVSKFNFGILSGEKVTILFGSNCETFIFTISINIITILTLRIHSYLLILSGFFFLFIFEAHWVDTSSYVCVGVYKPDSTNISHKDLKGASKQVKDKCCVLSARRW